MAIITDTIKEFGKNTLKRAGTGFLEGALGKTVGGAIASANYSGSGAKASGAQTGSTGDSGKDTVNAIRDLQSDFNGQAGIQKQISDALQMNTSALVQMTKNQNTTNDLLNKIYSKIGSGGGLIGDIPDITRTRPGPPGAPSKTGAPPKGIRAPNIKAGVGGLVGGLALDYGADYAEQQGYNKTAGVLSTGSYAASGAGLGATLGSVVPGLGTGVGAAVGGALGGAYGLYQNWGKISGGGDQTEQMAELIKKEEMQKAKAASGIEHESIIYNSKQIIFKADSIKFETTGGAANNTAGGPGGGLGGGSGAGGPAGGSGAGGPGPGISYGGSGAGGPAGGSGRSSGGTPTIDSGPGRNNSQLSSLIAGAESGRKGYNAYNRGTSGGRILGANQNVDLENMPVGELMRRQSLPISDPNRIFAAGKNQVIPSTMQGAVKALGIKPDEIFDKNMQDRILRDYLLGSKRPGVDAYITGKSNNVNAAVEGLAYEFASFPGVNGRGKYGDGNKVSVSPQQVIAALNDSKAKFAAAQKSGATEAEARRAAYGVIGDQTQTADSGRPGGAGAGAGAGGAGAGGGIKASSAVTAGAPVPEQTRARQNYNSPLGARLSKSEQNTLFNAGAKTTAPVTPGFSPAVEAAAAQARIAGRGKYMNQGQFGPNLPPPVDYGSSDASYRAQDASAAASEAMGAGGVNYDGTDARTLADAAAVGKVFENRKSRADAANLADLSNPANAYYDPAATTEQVSAERTDPAAITWAENQRAKMDAEKMQMGDAETVGGVPGFDAKAFSAGKMADLDARRKAESGSASFDMGSGGFGDGGTAGSWKAWQTDPSIQGGLNLQARSMEIEASKTRQFDQVTNPAAGMGFGDQPKDKTGAEIGHEQNDQAVASSEMLRSAFGDMANLGY